MTYSSFILAIRLCCEKAFRGAKRIVCLRRSCARFSVEMNGDGSSINALFYVLALVSFPQTSLHASLSPQISGGWSLRSFRRNQPRLDNKRIK